jgi:mono/diheme cytochrome c family protein
VGFLRTALWGLGAAAVAGAGIGLWLTMPGRVDPDEFANLKGDAVAGERVYFAAGCTSCHTSKEDPDVAVLSGGRAFASDFGTFYAPNISSDPVFGIGGWTLLEFANALQKGVSPEGQHYYPAFPYTNYARMTPQDVTDLFAYMQTLPASEVPSKAHDVSFPFNIRRSLGGWKLLFMDESWVEESPANERGRYLVEAMAHCGECHTPRNALGGIDRDKWLTGAPNPSGKGEIPGITPSQLQWSAVDIAYYLKKGFTPEFDSVGGSMASVVDNMAKLPAEDREAIAAYLVGLD